MSQAAPSTRQICVWGTLIRNVVLAVKQVLNFTVTLNDESFAYQAISCASAV
jgi:hypothetical protein